MSNDKIVITGISAISSCGVGFDALKDGIAKESSTTIVNQFEIQKTPRDMAVYQVSDEDFDPKAILGKKGLRTKDKATKMLLSTIELEYKEYLESLPREERPGLVIGTAFGSLESIGNFLSVSIETGVGSVNPKLFANTVINAPTGNANIRYDLINLSATISTGFNAGLDSFIYSCNQIKRGYYKSILTGSLEELSVYSLIGMEREGCLSKTDSAKPFGKNSDGYLLGEGCAVALVESEDAAEARGATVIAEIAGYAAGFAPNNGELGYNDDAEVPTEVIKMALENAGISASDVSFVVSDANGLTSGDAVRAKAIGNVFGDKTPVTAYKSKIGESYGAAGSLDIAATIADMQENRVSGVGAIETIDGINVVKDNIELTSTYAAVTAFSVDGNCTVVVLKNR